MNETPSQKVNDPNRNYAMYEADRKAKREAQPSLPAVTGEGNAPRKLKFDPVTRHYIGPTKKHYKARAEALGEALRKIAEREWSGEEKSWRAEAIEMQDEAREALAQWDEAQQ